MNILSNPVSLYGKKVVTDLATRTGMQTRDNFSYGLGMNFQVKQYWSGEETVASLDMLFNEQEDFNADFSQPHLSEEEYDASVEESEYEKSTPYNPAKDPVNFDRYYRRLEDIASPYLENYIGNLVYNICRRNGGIKQFNAKHREQPVLMSTGDDEGEFTELADLQLMNQSDDWPIAIKDYAKEHLAYVIKRLHNMSCYVGIHMLSFIVAFIRAEESNMHMRATGSQMILKKNAVIEKGVYTCDNQGNIKKRVLVENKNKKAEAMFNWIIGASDDYANYYQDYLDFRHYCNVLNIDLVNDDMTKYQADFVSKLVVTTVTPNRQYDKQVYNAIKSNSTTGSTGTESERDNISDTMSIFSQLTVLNTTIAKHVANFDSVLAKKMTGLATSIYNTYCLLKSSEMTDMNKYTWKDGYLHYNNQLVILPATFLSSPDARTFVDNRCIISELGYAIQVSGLASLYLMPIDAANANILNKVTYKDPEFKYYDWVRFST